MSTNPETTAPALERAAEAVERYDIETLYVDKTYEDEAHAVLSAALDVEEMAQVLSRASWPDGDHDGFPGKRVAGMLATALRAAILGEGS